MTELIKLHIGGELRKNGWKILNIQPGDHVDYVGDCLDLSRFENSSVAELYLSHVFEHLNYHREQQLALSEFKRVLAPGGRLMIGVPDLDVLAHLFVAPFLDAQAKFGVMKMMFGGQTNPYDYHRAGYNFVFLRSALQQSGFERIEKVSSFGLFQDTTEWRAFGVPISLNVQAYKPQ